MTKDNNKLGKFELTGLAPAPRGVPQIEVTFQIDSSGILEVSAEDKGTGTSKKISITAEKGRLSQEEIDRMVEEAARFADEDRDLRERIEARNGLESYLYNLRNVLEDDEKGIADSLSADDMKDLQDIVDETLDWLDGADADATTEEYGEKQKEVEAIANPIMRKAYGGRAAGTEDDFDFDDSDL